MPAVLAWGYGVNFHGKGKLAGRDSRGFYLDACCLSRLTDEQSQLRVRAEADAIEKILRIVRNGTPVHSLQAVAEWIWLTFILE